MRIGLAAILLIRQSDWLRPWVFLEHHRWVRGLDFLGPAARSPALESPLLPGLVLGATTNDGLVYARTILAVLLLLGVRPRLAALLLAVVSYVLLASDRYRYFHHLHLLYVSIAWLSLLPLGARLNLERALGNAWRRLRREAPNRAHHALQSTPRWGLQLFRAFVLSVYVAAGLSKLDGVWLSGETLMLLERFGVVGGQTWELLRSALGYGTLAKLTCVTELALPTLLAFRVTRRWAILGGLGFHTIISASMMVSTFGVEMAVLLIAFWPDTLDESAANREGALVRA